MVGDGGFGVVYRGVHTGFGEPIAVKCLKLPRALDDAQRKGFLEQLREEGRLLHRLSKATPGIVQALDVGALTTADGAWVPYLILEWLEGDTLADHLTKRRERGEPPFGLVDAIRLLEPAARALGVAHAMKVAHRDVKPHNLFVTKVGSGSTLKVLDFGIAKVVTDYPTFREALAATQAKPTAFTPRYGAPEQFNKARGPSGPWTDVFALGLILVELCTGEKALEGDDPTQLYIAAADPAIRPTLRARGLRVSDAVEAVVARALAVEPSARYADATELCDALLAAAGLSPASTLPPGSALRTSPVPQRSDEARTVAEARRVLAGTEPTEVAPGNAPAPPKGGGRVGATAPDSMSETPFFDRHHLPPSVAVGAPAPRPLAASDPPRVPSVPSRKRSWVAPAVAVALGGAGAAAYVSLDLGTMLGGGRPASSSVASTTPILPTSKSSSPARTARPASSGAPAASTAPARNVSTSDMVTFAPATVHFGDRDVSVHAFLLDRGEVTARAYAACVAKRQCPAADRVSVAGLASGARFAPEGDAGDAAYVETWSKRCTGREGDSHAGHPINCVDFASAEAFCRWAGKRLPTDAEWELAARGATGRAYPWGDEPPSCGRACYDKSGGCRSSAGAATCTTGGDRTPEGIFDLAGNVAEWTSDATPSGARTVRGGSFLDAAELLKSGSRAEVPPALAHVAIGLRCALDDSGAARP